MTISDLELRTGVDPLEGLLRERTLLVERIAKLRPLFGPIGGWDLKRKIELARLEILVRAHATATEKVAPTVAQVQAEAHAHPQYVAFITQGLKLAEEWARSEERLKAIDMQINRGQALIRFAASEPR